MSLPLLLILSIRSRLHRLIICRSLGIDAEYYIRNLLIPPLSRIFNLVGADVEHWYDSMPRTKRAGRYDTAASTSGGGQAFSFSHQGQVRPKAKGRAAGKMRIDSHFKSSHCIVCGSESVSSESCCVLSVLLCQTADSVVCELRETRHPRRLIPPRSTVSCPK
jgi:hypothetical protein